VRPHLEWPNERSPTTPLWPAINLAELRYSICFGSSIEEIADFLQRDVEDVWQKLASQALFAANADE
jgi:hypothetical protein